MRANSFKRSFVRKSASGVSKIQRSNYSSVTMSWWEISAAVRKRDNNYCVPCARAGKYVKGKDVHHIISLRNGGTTTMANLMTVCDDCHNRRHNHMFRARKS